MERTKKKINIVLTNAWSYYNKGDAAIVVSMIKNLDESFPMADFSLLAFDPESFELSKKMGEIPQRVNILPEICCTRTFKSILSKDHAGTITLFLLLLLPIIVKVFQIFDSSLNNTIRALKRADIIVSCGGNQLHSVAGFSFLRNLYPLIWGKLICKKPIMIFSQSIGPISGYLNQRILKFFLEHVDCITLRENFSERYLLDVLRIRNPNLLVTADATFMLDLNPQNLQLKKRLRSKKIGITLRQWFFFHRKFYHRYIRVIASFIDYLKEVYDAEVVLFSFSQVLGFEDDLTACKEVYNLVRDKNRLNIIQLRNLSLNEISKELLKINVLIGTRMHSVIFASILDIPSVAISYTHHKSEGISKMLGLIKPLNMDNLTLNQLIDVYKKLLRFSPSDLHSHVQDIRTRTRASISIINSLLERER